MAVDVNIHITLDGVVNVASLHVHIPVIHDDALLTKGVFVANMADLMAKIAELQAAQTETLKDVKRLIELGDTTAAVTAVDAALAQNTEIDAAVEAAAPEVTTPPVEPPLPFS